jgi:hypothetical protein
MYVMLKSDVKIPSKLSINPLTQILNSLKLFLLFFNLKGCVLTEQGMFERKLFGRTLRSFARLQAKLRCFLRGFPKEYNCG